MLRRVREICFISLAISLFSCGGSGPSVPPGPAIRGQVVARGLAAPMLYVAAPGDATKGYVIERSGKVKLLINDVLQPTDVLDITGTVVTAGECGLLGIAFDPNYVVTKHVFLHYNAGSPIETRIVRYTMNPGGTSLSNPFPIFSFQQTSETNHKGGAINFGAGGYLFMMTGDGGGQNDPNNFAQTPTSYFGKILRIDVTVDDFPSDSDQNYGIPATNPWVGVGGVKPEIWGFGLRNPFRWSIDPVTNGLLIADVGQGALEEVNYEPASMGQRNYGWNMREGNQPSGNTGPAFFTPLKDPMFEYSHSFGSSIIGGFVYRGTGLDASFQGKYFFADYISAKIASIPFSLSGGEANPVAQGSIANHTSTINTSLAADTISGPVSVTADANGEIMICDLNNGTLIRLIP
jgi:glucose/arabinose dehydrogenase